jgi:hypothetical protein
MRQWHTPPSPLEKHRSYSHQFTNPYRPPEISAPKSNLLGMYNTASITKRRIPNCLLFGSHQLRNIMIKILLALIRAFHSNNPSIRVFAVENAAQCIKDIVALTVISSLELPKTIHNFHQRWKKTVLDRLSKGQPNVIGYGMDISRVRQGERTVKPYQCVEQEPDRARCHHIKDLSYDIECEDVLNCISELWVRLLPERHPDSTALLVQLELR